MGARITRLERSMDRLESRLDHIEQMLVGYCLDVARIK
jgi:chaperonin cofactor prefoldin